MSTPATSSGAPAAPLALLRRWLEEARGAGEPAPAAMTLVTATGAGGPSARVVSLKRLEDAGLVFTTALWSRKAVELRANPRVAAVFFWPALGRQVRVEGSAEVADRELAEALFAERRRSHQLQAHASRQGEEIEDHTALRRRLEGLERELAGAPVPCPPDWGAVRVVPDRLEFWQEDGDRLHRREQYDSEGSGWRRALLAP